MVACRIIVSAPVPVPFLWTLDFGFGTWILDLDFKLGFGTGLGLDKNLFLESTVTMECSFKLEESESLYSIKLYKGREEFLHFVPAFHPPYKVFSTKGVRVSWSVNKSFL